MKKINMMFAVLAILGTSYAYAAPFMPNIFCPPPSDVKVDESNHFVASSAYVTWISDHEVLTPHQLNYASFFNASTSYGYEEVGRVNHILCNYKSLINNERVMYFSLHSDFSRKYQLDLTIWKKQVDTNFDTDGNLIFSHYFYRCDNVDVAKCPFKLLPQ